MNIQVAVQKHHICPGGRIETRPQRGTFSSIALAHDRLYGDMRVAVAHRCKPRKHSVRSVGAAIVDRHQFDVYAMFFEKIGYLLEIVFRLGRKMIERHHNREPPVADGLAHKRPSLVSLGHLYQISGRTSGVIPQRDRRRVNCTGRSTQR